MILPTKRLAEDRALLAVGAEVLELLDEPKTVSRVWSELKAFRVAHHSSGTLTYDWFVLALDLLFAMRAVQLERGRLLKMLP